MEAGSKHLPIREEDLPARIAELKSIIRNAEAGVLALAEALHLSITSIDKLRREELSREKVQVLCPFNLQHSVPFATLPDHILRCLPKVLLLEPAYLRVPCPDYAYVHAPGVVKISGPEANQVDGRDGVDDCVGAFPCVGLGLDESVTRELDLIARSQPLPSAQDQAFEWLLLHATEYGLAYHPTLFELVYWLLLRHCGQPTVSQGASKEGLDQVARDLASSFPSSAVPSAVEDMRRLASHLWAQLCGASECTEATTTVGRADALSRPTDAPSGHSQPGVERCADDGSMSAPCHLSREGLNGEIARCQQELEGFWCQVGYLKSLARNVQRQHQLSREERYQRHEKMAQVAEEERKLRPHFRPVTESSNFGMDSSRRAPEEAGHASTPELASVSGASQSGRELKRRRASYRAKNVHVTKRSFTETFRALIADAMAEISAAAQGQSRELEGGDDAVAPHRKDVHSEHEAWDPADASRGLRESSREPDGRSKARYYHSDRVDSRHFQCSDSRRSQR